MNISFDLDSTLIPNGSEFETEHRSLIAKLFGIEELRKGTKKLMSQLEKDGHRIHIYTTSFRTKRKIRRTLKYYGIKVNSVINQKENQNILRSKNINASKYPKAFNFDLHIDDSKGVAIEAKKYNFETLIIKPSDKHWIETVIKHIKNLN